MDLFYMVFLVRIFNKNIITIDQIRGMNEDKIFSNKKQEMILVMTQFHLIRLGFIN